MPAEGAGVWFTHSLDRGAVWHAPAAVIYGERPVKASIAAVGDTVAVEYKHPGTTPQRIWLALSRSTSHIFETRLPVSGGSGWANASGTPM